MTSITKKIYDIIIKNINTVVHSKSIKSTVDELINISRKL